MLSRWSIGRGDHLFPHSFDATPVDTFLSAASIAGYDHFFVRFSQRFNGGARPTSGNCLSIANILDVRERRKDSFCNFFERRCHDVTVPVSAARFHVCIASPKIGDAASPLRLRRASARPALWLWRRSCWPYRDAGLVASHVEMLLTVSRPFAVSDYRVLLHSLMQPFRRSGRQDHVIHGHIQKYDSARFHLR